ncbi:g9215 [Coccomyxa elongata]
MCVSAATLRVFGTAFAELPFVATRDGYRRDGNLTRLMHANSWPGLMHRNRRPVFYHCHEKYTQLGEFRSGVPFACN